MIYRFMEMKTEFCILISIAWLGGWFTKAIVDSRKLLYAVGWYR